VDIIHSNENAHSRILTKLFQYQYDKKYILLNEFLKYIKIPFDEKDIESPKITAEENRIDARIRLKTATIIIENKIYGAVEQKKQIDRYIQNEINEGYNIDQIYVLYLTRDGGSPSNYSLSDNNRTLLNNRFKEVNFKDDILGWLNLLMVKIFPNINSNKTVLLESAIIQYQDYLKGLFFEREGERAMKEEIINLIEENFNINKLNNLKEKLDRVSEINKYTLELSNYLSEFEDNLLIEKLSIFKQHVENKKTSFKGIENVEYVNKFGEKYSHILFKPVNWNSQFFIGISFDNRLSNLFYGIYNKNNNSSAELQNIFTKLIDSNNDPNFRWPFGVWITKERINSEFILKIEDGTFLIEFKNIIDNILTKTSSVKELYERD
jgi:hypothetical protein